MDSGHAKMGHTRNLDDYDGATSGMAGLNIDSLSPGKSKSGMFKKQQGKIAGFALKQLEKNFPKQGKLLKDFYAWTTSSEDEFNLLKNIVKSF